MRQRLGSKKHKLCEEIAQVKYASCWTCGGWTHYTAQCWRDGITADEVDYKNKTWKPEMREGKFV